MFYLEKTEREGPSAAIHNSKFEYSWGQLLFFFIVTFIVDNEVASLTESKISSYNTLGVNSYND